ncbi:hypothetical protein FN846DRAFT_942609 [Sphaerosporella brunnea]|uniref:ATP-grasp fold PylC-type domain-containing protein n=1 Tax=Sphaerosporella brunnea TaxID=1250544 RepID=A0A5J5F130_9PEZI|nr:hypothetical protein FN846DRAFT_942609 [Sphaerosporella brunnea]
MSCLGLSRRSPNPSPLRILLTNGRFPVSLDLARQLRLLSHTIVIVADPMHYHVCKFSRSTKKSYQVPAPRVDAGGYIQSILSIIREEKIDLIIPMHEEIFYLAESREPEIVNRLFAPPWEILLRLHNKFSFAEWLRSVGLLTPVSHLCRSRADVERLLQAPGEWAVKPVFGRAARNVYHLRQGDKIPDSCDVGEGNHYIAQQWLTGQRYCSYMVIRAGRVQAFCLYPVQDTIDGSSCVYFRSIAHPAVEEYCTRIAAALPGVGAQLAFDFIEVPGQPVVAIECNPRATSGIHLFSGTPLLAQALVSGPPAPPPSAEAAPAYTTFTVVPPLGAKRQLAPGMLMWQKSERGVKAYLEHMGRLMGSKDVVFSKSDLLPSLMQPFLLTSYYEICRERKLGLPEMFQWDLVWMVETSLGTKGPGGEERGNEGVAIGEKLEKRRSEDSEGGGPCWMCTPEDRRDSGVVREQFEDSQDGSV